MKDLSQEDILELIEENKHLKQLIEKKIRENRQKDEILFQQNKMAAMGEMLSNISHQWRQPLMEISSIFLPIQGKLELNLNISNEEILTSIEKLNDITKYMSNTIEDFKNFFATNKELTEFKVTDQINTAYKIMGSSFKNSKIMLEIIIKKNVNLYGYKNEYTQVLINILSNAKDVLINRKILNPKIIITVDQSENNSIISIEDNAGGVNTFPIENIFKPFFSFEKKNGTGIGLFMSKLIIENNMNGKLTIQNTSNGALFKIITSTKIK